MIARNEQVCAVITFPFRLWLATSDVQYLHSFHFIQEIDSTSKPKSAGGYKKGLCKKEISTARKDEDILKRGNKDECEAKQVCVYYLACYVWIDMCKLQSILFQVKAVDAQKFVLKKRLEMIAENEQVCAVITFTFRFWLTTSNVLELVSFLSGN